MTTSTGPRRALIFTGNGKGKTTAALGMVLRASGHGHRVSVIQFVKDDDTTGEVSAVKHLPGVSLEQTGLGFVPKPDHPQFVEHKERAEEGLAVAKEATSDGTHDLVVLDEACVAISLGLIDEASVLELIAETAPQTAIVLTGRGASERLIEAVDTVTEMRMIRHGLQQGLTAEKGVEW